MQRQKSSRHYLPVSCTIHKQTEPVRSDQCQWVVCLILEEKVPPVDLPHDGAGGAAGADVPGLRVRAEADPRPAAGAQERVAGLPPAAAQALPPGPRRPQDQVGTSCHDLKDGEDDAMTQG